VSAMTLVAAERIKLLSTRSPWWCAGLAIISSIGLSAVIAAATVNDGQVATVASTQLGYVLGMAVVMVMTTLAVTTEYSVGTIRTTFMAIPRRGPALIAKAFVVAALAAIVGLIGAFGAWAATMLLLPDADLSLSGLDDWRHIAGVGLVYLIAAVIAVAIGTLVRHTAGAVSIVLVWALMAEQLFQLLPGIGEAVRPWLPFSAAKDFLTAEGTSVHGVLGGGPWVAIAYFALVAALLLGISIAVAGRRDA
jgi:ABC-2 type transport system permease protein